MNMYQDYTGFADPMKSRDELHDSRGVRKTQMLFVDVNINKDATPLYTMRDYDYKGCISAYQIYMHSVDEYEAALKLVGSIDHWDKLCNLKWFMEGMPVKSFTGVEQWRKDMKRRDLMLAKRTLMSNLRVAKDTSAARAIVQLYKEPAAKKPTQKEQAEANNKAAQQDKAAKVTSMLDRIKKKGE